jgi:ribonucleoside-diphosphate reductase alpha chain
MTNWRDGSVNFEQRGVEFPDFWSSTRPTSSPPSTSAARSAPPEREWSLKQLIDRVVKTYRKAGEEHGYFATPADAEIFEHELTWMLLHQVFSFNSPVWFNVGTASPQQVSACFILSVDDSMDSILNWYKEEGLIFKGGSGAGSTSPASAPPRSCSPPAAPPVRPGSASCAAPTRPPARSSPAAPPGARPRWSSSTSTTPTSRSSSRPRRARRTRSAPARRRLRHGPRRRDITSCSTRTPTTRSGSPTSSCRRSRTAPSSTCAAGSTARSSRPSTPRAVPQDRPGRVGVRRPGHAVRRHDQRLAHQPGDRPDHRVQPVLGVHAPGQLVLQPGLAQPDEVPPDDGGFDVAEVRQAVELVITAMDISICFADFPTEPIGETTQVPPARHRLRQPRRAADGDRPRRTTPTAAARSPPRSPR